MSALEGLSVANNDLATNEVFFADQNQAKLNKTASHLASGLSIQSPADDPARYSQAKHTEVAASSLDEASADLQNTQNALTVASAALSTITDIVQRMRVLCVAANNTTLSPSDVANIQDEIGQLNTQVNTICANTQFNGTPLFKSTSVVTAPPTVVQTVDTYLSNPTASEPNSVSVTLHSQPVVGDVLIAAVAHDDGYGGGGGSAVITPPAGWTLVTTGDNGFNDGFSGLRARSDGDRSAEEYVYTSEHDTGKKRQSRYYGVEKRQYGKPGGYFRDATQSLCCADPAGPVADGERSASR